jgi:hypothetical protein
VSSGGVSLIRATHLVIGLEIHELEAAQLLSSKLMP